MAEVKSVQSCAVAQALADAESRFITNNPLSKNQHDLAVISLPGGNTRTLLHTSPFPLTMVQGKGVYIYDSDRHKYLDLTGDLSAGLFGHTPLPPIRRAIMSALDDVGLSMGATTALEQQHAALLCERFHIDHVRMTNSGTEANIYALAAARHFTGKRKVVVFSGGYHGGVLSFPDGKPAANTVDPDDFVVVPRYNDTDAALNVIKSVEEKGQLAAVLVEAVQGSGGVVPGTRDFLAKVREATKAAGAIFILDEVMTSRLSPHGLGVEYGLKPDMLTLGKYLGGGFSFGAFGGRKDVMAVYDPRLRGGLSHSGTFNNNTMAMLAGYTALSEVFTPEASIAFNRKGDAFRERLVAVSRGTKLSFTGKGSLIGVHFSEDGTEDITSGSDLAGKERADLKDLFWFEMLEEGFWIARRGYMALILQTPEEELDRLVGAVERFLEKYRGLMSV
ncbi:pyridoxal phosphate-dependent transferase [Echria macrotheca]|uniref:Pyridoxal phosphate-dependent transferase n=1 Tax=Echria macrotheca TaxID=438768 RepID=A0AAJ0B6Z0_9PEZI|nr:pyridoxal phosphate-dependent transferase [Echria macrotheca]